MHACEAAIDPDMLHKIKRTSRLHEWHLSRTACTEPVQEASNQTGEGTVTCDALLTCSRQRGRMALLRVLQHGAIQTHSHSRLSLGEL
jgi:hypothetical protein